MVINDIELKVLINGSNSCTICKDIIISRFLPKINLSMTYVGIEVLVLKYKVNVNLHARQNLSYVLLLSPMLRQSK